jgi:WD40 repeat protein
MFASTQAQTKVNISVRNALRSLVGKFTSPGTNTARTLDCSSINDIEQLLAVSRDEDDDFATIHSQWFPGTCSWLLDQACVKSFLTPVSQSHVLWYSAPPGSGKSVMSAFVVDHLRQQGLEPQFYFFRHADQKQRSLSHCLHTIAYQLVTHDVNFRARVHGLAKEGLRMAKAGPKLVWQKLFESILFSVELTSRPLFWVIDGLDEADSPGILFELLHSLSRSRQSVRLLIVSRKTQTLSSAFDGLSEKIQVSRLENAGLAHNSDDIVTIVGREVELMSGSESFKSATKCSIIQRAEGNILWVRLVLREILACHTEDEVRQSLHDIPSDMTSFYKRMENAIAKNPARANTTLAKTLLHWSVCSRRRLKLEELEGAMPSILNLRRTINEICGQLVVVDAGGTVGLIHQTAGEYLTGPSASELHIDRVCAHEELCLATIAALSRPGLRVEATEQPQAVKQAVSFTTYAATSWTCHLLESSQSDKSIDAAAKFLHGTAVLTWIHILALLDQLDVLVRAAKDFTSAATKIRKAQAGKNPLLQKLAEVELLERWSVDLTKIVAKFRKPLQEEPMTIYKVIPAMCPALSITYEQFSRSHSLEVTLSGIPPDAWNDNLVRLAMPNGDKGTQIVSAGSHVAVLGTVGTTYVWGSRDFRLARTLDHGEPVTAICLNKKGDRLATSGLKSTKSWSIETGETLSCTPNIADVKAMALEYTDDDKELLVVADDRIVRSLDLTDISSAWQVLCEGPARQDDFEKKFVNSPNCVRFNGDRTQVGLSYRGFPLAVWSLAENRCIGRSKRSRSFRGGSGRPSTTWFGVDRFTFNPITGHVIGVYKDGCVFKWHPLTGENQEAQAVADEVAASPDGKLFITTDTDGNIAVWSFAYMTKIYQLNSNDLVTGLVFSPDARRFYDIRGRSANAWEPNALVRFAEREASHTDTASEEQTSDTTHTSEAHLDPFEPITAMAVISSSATFCFGDEEGAVYSYDADTEQKFQLMKFSNYQCISHLELSAQGDCVVAADLSGEVMIKLLGTQPLGKKKPTPEVNSLQRPRFDLQGHGIDHILFNRLGNLLLVASNDSAQVWSIDRASIIACNPLELGSRRKWILHPTKDDLFLGFGPRDVDAYRWTTLEKVVTIPICEEGLEANDIHHRPQPSASESQVTKALSTEDGQHVIIQVRELVRGVSCKRLMIFDSDACDSLTAPSTRALHYRRLPQDIHCKVDIALGILRKDRSFQLAFLDCDLWLCTLELEGPQHHATVKRRYFVPRDWASTESLELSHVLTDGTLLSPKGADVAIVTYSGDT